MTEAEPVTFKDWKLRIRGSHSTSPRILLLIHGWTGDENSMWVFTRGLSPDYWMIAPRAPYVAEPSGYSWRPPQPQTFGRPNLEMLRPAAEALIRLVDEFSASIRVDASQFDVVGFSQGAAMVNVLGLLHPQRIRKMGVLAGFVPAGLEQTVEREPLTGKHIFVAHGTDDPLIPIDRARTSIKLLEKAGAQITYCEDDVGHKVSANCLRALERYLKD